MANENVVFITGASRGFGAAAARLIASRGNVVVASMRNPQRDGAAVREGLEDRIHTVNLDVTDTVEVNERIHEAEQRFGRVDVVINNAGFGLYGPVEEASDEELWGQLDTNLLGQWRLIKAALPGMRERGSGKIINVSSVAGRMATGLLGHYAASKHAVEAMTEALRYEVGGLGVQAAILEPGMFASDWQTTNLGVSDAMASGKSAYQATVDAALERFRNLAITRPGSDSVATALADMVELEQPLPLRWPVGNDAVHMTALRRSVVDETWHALRSSGALGEWRKPLPHVGPAPHRDTDWAWASGNVVLITGGSRGFGEAAARACAVRGNTVVATMRNSERDADGVRDGFEDSIQAMQLDVTDNESIQRAVAETIDRFGRIDVLVNNAGYGLYGPVEDVSEEEIRNEFDTNYIGSVRMLRAVLPHMRAAGRGKVVNVSSLSGQVSSPLLGFYAASKYAVEAMSESMSDEVAPFGIQVTVLEPGQYRSDWQTTNLDLCMTAREGRSPYQRGVDRSLEAFRARAITRPGSDAVGAAIADIVHLQQPLPLRWPIGDDTIRTLEARRTMSDDQWEDRMRSAGATFTTDDVSR